SALEVSDGGARLGAHEAIDWPRSIPKPGEFALNFTHRGAALGRTSHPSASFLLNLASPRLDTPSRRMHVAFVISILATSAVIVSYVGVEAVDGPRIVEVQNGFGCRESDVFR